MKRTKVLAAAVALVVILSLFACSSRVEQGDASIQTPESLNTPESSPQPVGQIYLYGEQHGVKKILDREFELWYEYYHNEGMRHLFVEYSYYTAQFLNLWMQADSDEILDAIYADAAGTFMQNPDVKAFLQKIKEQCPETIFHGTDVGHQHETTGERFVKTLRDNHQEDSEQYKRAQEVIEQGKIYYDRADDIYRENKMVENFIYELDTLRGENIMGIYGAAHTGLEAMYPTQGVACMAKQLKQHYGDSIHSEDLSVLAKATQPERVDVIAVNAKEYQASYFGKEDLTGFKDYVFREFWRLENAYEDFKNQPKSGDVLPFDNYPMLIKQGQIFVIDYGKIDGSVKRGYYLSDGKLWQDRPATEEFTIE